MRSPFRHFVLEIRICHDEDDQVHQRGFRFAPMTWTLGHCKRKGRRNMKYIRILCWIVGIGLCGAMLERTIERPISAADGTTSAKAKPRANRLAKETSPYLLMHAHNPVDWYPWGPEAFEKAKKEDKLIFLSIGYSSCYWCHVMERNVFSNEAIAKTLNQDFVCIKVDREERPDIDDIYMTALIVYSRMAGNPSGGGWPMSMFLTPEGKPVVGGTYFPPEDTESSHGFPTVLAKLTDFWKNKREQLVANADIVANETRRQMLPKPSLKPIEINEDFVTTIYSATASSFDPQFGGLDFNPQRPDGPKFPTPTKLLFLQQMVERNPDEDVAKFLDLTLMQLACGGIRDHLGGGFHRYSVDRRWDVPHFEKMLYDQAQLADLYVQGFRLTQRPLYKQVAQEIFAFIAREMTSPEGGFYSAFDAESDGIEGKFYVWDASEVDNILGTASAGFKEAYIVKDLPDFEQGNVLRLSIRRLPKPATGDALNQETDGVVRDEFSLARQKLLDVRSKRKVPMRDEKILTSWNGLMIGAYARASDVLQNPEYRRTAEKAAGLLLSKLRDPQGRLLHSYTKNQAKLNAYLDDYAFLIDGLLALHDVSDDAKWLKAATQLQNDQLRFFLDVNNGGFFFTSHQHEELLARTKDCSDGVLPAGNSVSARNLIKLAAKTGTSSYKDEARAVIESFAPNVERMPRLCTNLALAAAEILESEAAEKTTAANDPPKEIQTTAGTDKKAAEEPLVLLAGQNEKGAKKDEPVKARVYLSTDKLPAGSTCQFVVVLNVEEKWHINQNPADPDNLIPVKVSFKSKLGVTSSAPKYPKGHKFYFKSDTNKETPLMVHEGEVAIYGTLTVPEKLGGQTDEIDIVVKYQACNEDETCLPPKEIKLAAKPGVAKKGEPIKSINARLFNAAADAPAKTAPK